MPPPQKTKTQAHVTDPDFANYVSRLIRLIESGEAVASDLEAGNRAFDRMRHAIDTDQVPFTQIDAVRKLMRRLALVLS